MADYISPQTGTIHIDIHGRDYKSLSILAQDRLKYKPRYPYILGSPEKCTVSFTSNEMVMIRYPSMIALHFVIGIQKY